MSQKMHESISKLSFEIHRLEEMIKNNRNSLELAIILYSKEHFNTHTEIEKELSALRQDLKDVKIALLQK